MSTKVSDRGAFTSATHEGLVPTRYIDVVGMHTYGIGHTHNAGSPDPRTMSYEMPKDVRSTYKSIWDLYIKRLSRYSDDVIGMFGPNLEQHELDGLTGWHFNTGGAFESSAVKQWASGDKGKAVKTIMSWNKGTVNGKKVVLPALVDRRKEEANLILNGIYPGRELAVYGTDGRGRINWKPIETFTWEEWREFIGHKSTPTTSPLLTLLNILLKLFKR